MGEIKEKEYEVGRGGTSGRKFRKWRKELHSYVKYSSLEHTRFGIASGLLIPSAISELSISMPWSSKWYIPSGFQTKILYAFLISRPCYMNRPSHPP
jgi:hypothetical protein